ncbi:LLM class oxidoreductase [Hyphomicrobium sp. ghe19]|uniref:LLM class oxidoreductase n=1 Tax=Hyphomicrobium sp. ghe19 TaxID=2682968 RepID=UPI00136706F8|nr:Alkanal monooxygenase alpha chain [Hyphomicrobium sp. ghe19]
MGKPLHIATVAEHRAFRRMFSKNRMTIGVFFPIEAFEGDVPAMSGQERLAQQAEKLGFSALWTRDVPLRDPTFGDVGQIYDAWVWLGWIAAQTSMIGLATGSIVLPLRHPIHTAKAAASIDQLSNGRFVMAVASGDRPVEFPAFGVDWNKRDVLFRENFRVLRELLKEEFPRIESVYGTMLGTADLVPKPTGRLPLLVTGSSRQSLDWIAANADGWITYPRSPELQKVHVARWHATVAALAPGTFKPFAQSLYVDLSEDPNAPPRPIHLGFSGGRKIVLRFLDALQVAGVNHVALNLKYSKRSAGEVLDEIGREIIPVLQMSRGPAAVSM